MKQSLNKIKLPEIGLHSNMLQSSFWGSLKQEFGWQAFAFSLCDDEPVAHTLLVLVRELGAGQSLAYIPHGPMKNSGPTAESWEASAELAEALRPHLPGSCMFIRFDPPWGITTPAIAKEPAGYPETELSPLGTQNANTGDKSAARAFRKARMDIQPPSTVILDLNKTEDELLAGMKSKTRYNIRLAAKKGVEVRTAGIEDLPEWYELYRVTAERDKIALHGYDYYERIFELAAEQTGSGCAPELRLLQAVIDGVVEAGIITAWQGAPGVDRLATYLYGASSNNKRNYMPAYALQWEAIKQAAAAGCTGYDFFGIPPVDNPDHPMYGLYRFKTGFGGEILHRPGCWDFPYKKAAYAAFSTAEKARNYYYKTLRKR
ncbi:MAG: peptidoglycan bridge formation glycyltransferase FemA/FemB family protein [Spirochaetales bacterium]|uniref:Peptidoglycan bridge formation glycyltransferase FemA/FemB family protein n=1 Tax=Candidatus Thalassospirochaeta sargassi TaxID=3119039 RepID=A0AAJ1MJB7_9SPIO|nr:peptidoglycan bridge formation glycyltransferase FemA/FemB family protein [Spirochaetales bacterium]